jgi:hypothetical protein
MSTDYRFLTPIKKRSFKAALKKCGLKENKNDNSTENSICVTDGTNYIWFYAHDKKHIDSCSRYGGNWNGETTIIQVLANHLKVGYLSEYDDGYFQDEDEDEEIKLA